MIKTLTFASMHFSIAFGVTYLLTGDIVVGGLVAIVEPAVNTVAFFFHEKVWNRVTARRQQAAEQQANSRNAMSGAALAG
ncbi:MAG: hypothetical protein CL810_12680 [Cobetia sp.]|jgi:uncharacterized membrane protein|uniref:DUF2061 domain-containing protein n=1 Tax=Cobetia TaxID=204286 RepID=UPI000C5A200A|nr:MULTISPECIES: DUF2061 domain-containing protein [Cobetia]MBR9797468.1 DUF2061 domain-containing protein [Gammaproteobacteria bacterium]MBF07559.1 hypothetical protein [Cobetia sp.]MBK10392.1 hypothetical protein [Cobetia sp.]MBS4152359.1 DUF2061 domain-containing protein [Cobetia sp. MC34]MBU3006501.1 DUF2061 domain-containing protein [Cobetia amphilecti]|tara:strand:+ start:107369 stop:107608 length:240 start_codon:yes stop_codon:yes gene_type:complete